MADSSAPSIARQSSTTSTLQNESPSLPAKQWSDTRRWNQIFTVCLACFLVGINSTAILSAADEIASEFSIDTSGFDYTFFLVTAWNAGAAFIPLLVLPSMEDFGVRWIYIVLYILFFIFVIVQAVAPNFATLIVSRAIAGSCGGVVQNSVDGMISDIWREDESKRSLSLSFYIFALLGGVTFGPVMGGAIIKSLGWRWISYIQIIIYGILFPYILFSVRETRALPDPTKRGKSVKQRIMAALDETIFRAVHMLCTEYVVFTFTLWSAFSFGTVFLLTQSIPLIYTALYSWPTWETGVIQVAVFIGEIIGLGLSIFQDSVIYPHFSIRNKSEVKSDVESNEQSERDARRLNLEARLYTSVPAAFLGLTAGFFIYAWTSSPSDGYPWPLPTLGLLLIGIGIMCIIQAITTYITDVYASQTSSAVSAVALGENLFAAFLPLATKAMYTTLGFPWASSLLGFLALGISCAPIALIFIGSKIRARSKFAG